MANELVVLRDGIAESGFVTAEVYLSPLPGTEPMRVKARIGSLVRDILPPEARAPMVCIIDGIPMKREWWMQRPVCEGDRIQFAPVYLGGGNGGSRSILAMVAMIAVAVVANWAAPNLANAIWGAGNVPTWGTGLIRAGLILVGNALISAILPPVSGGSLGEGDRGSAVYSVDTQGNQARLFHPIPVQYGRLRYYPNYASQPYVEYVTSKPNDILISRGTAEYKDGLQFYYALFCLGQGEYDVERVQLADANIYPQNLCVYDDVLVCKILRPGERPTYVNPVVVNSEAVAGQSLDEGNAVGPFPACGPSRKLKKVSFDIIFPQGLCNLNEQGKASGHGVQIVIDGSEIDDSGEQIGPWEQVYNNTISSSSLTPQRRTITITPSKKTRWQYRMRRVGKRDAENNRVMESVQWGALRGFLDEEAPLCKTATHLELVLRASEQLSSVSQRKISVTATRKLPSWDDPTPRATRSPAHALWDKWTNPVYGDGMPRDRIDVETLKRYAALAEQRGDLFDYVFENRTSSQEADQLIAKVMRCVALQRQGVKTIVRDELVDMPLTLFNPTNTDEKSVSLEYIQITEETTDGVVVEFFNEKTWDWQDVECPGPGRTYSNTSHPRYNPKLPVMENPARITLNGIVTIAHAEREGLYYAYTNALRRQFITWTTELQGATLYYGAPVLFSSTLYNAMQGGEVRDYDEDADILSLSAPVKQGKIMFMKPNGTLSNPLSFSVVDDNGNWIKVHDTIDFPVYYGSHAKERTKYVIVEGELIRRIVKVLSIMPKGLSQSGAPSYELRGVVDVPEVHTIDGTVVAPSTPPEIPRQYVRLDNVTVNTKQAVFPNNGYPATIVFNPDGTVRSKYFNGRGIVMEGDGEIWGSWISSAPAANVGSEYDIMLMGGWSVVDGEGDVVIAPPFDISDPNWFENVNRPYMKGYRLNQNVEYILKQSGSDTVATQAALRFARNYMGDSGSRKAIIVFTDWMPLTSVIELQGCYDLTPRPIPSQPASADSYPFFAAIRKRSTGEFQDAAAFQLGIWR